MIITIREILEVMESGVSFSLKVISFDAKRKKGGTILEFAEAQLVKKEQSSGRPPTLMEQKRAQLKQRKNPHHKRWYTRNIRTMVNGHPTAIIKKIHPPLIIEFNGKNVVP